MFTGLVEEVGSIAAVAPRGKAVSLSVRCKLGGGTDPLVLGESVSVSGVCLTVTRFDATGFDADVSLETLAKTKLGQLSPGSWVNLERASKLGSRMGGHIVSGHVDTVGQVAEITELGDMRKVSFQAPAEFAPFVAAKGSIAIDGTSLTINGVTDGSSQLAFDVMLVPHTLGQTTLSRLDIGQTVNLEMDVVARYVVRNLTLLGRPDDSTQRDERLMDLLRQGGYVR